MSLELDDEETKELIEKLREARDELKTLRDDYDILGKFLIVFCALPKGATLPEIGITATEAYLHLNTNGTKGLRERLQKFVDFGSQFLNGGTNA